MRFGLGAGDLLVMGAPTANATLILLNPLDLDGNGVSRRFVSIRGVGNVPEGEYAGPISSANGAALTGSVNLSFDGNGGLIFANGNSTYTTTNIAIDSGAAFVAASDPAQAGQPGALGEGTATMQVGTSTATNPAGQFLALQPTANLAFMTYGGSHGVDTTNPAVVITARNITVGGTGVEYASVVLGGFTNDWTQMTGTVTLNSDRNAATFNAIPTIFYANNGGRVDFTGQITGNGAVQIGGTGVKVEGDANTAGILLGTNGTVVFSGSNNYTGATSVNGGNFYINNSNGPSNITVNSGGNLGGNNGVIGGNVTINAGGTLEAGMAGLGGLSVEGSLTFNAPASIIYTAVGGAVGQGSRRNSV